MEIGVEWIGEFATEEPVERHPGRALDDLGEEITEGERRVAAHRVGLVPRAGVRKDRPDPITVPEVVECDGSAVPGESGSMNQHLARGDCAFPVLRELRPVRGDGLVEVEQAPVDQHQDHDHQRDLRRREDPYDGVGLPGRDHLVVAGAAPEVDDVLAVDGDGQRRTLVEPVVEVASERLLEQPEPFVAESVDPGHRPSPSPRYSSPTHVRVLRVWQGSSGDWDT